jgi:predicted nucleic acid-binding protein
MVLKILRQDATQVMLVKDHDVIQSFAADRADETLDIGVLPR